MDVVDHRQDRGPRLGRSHDRLGLGIVGDVQAAQGILQRQPHGGHHVELADVLAQRLARALVPADVEADGQGACGRAGLALLGLGDAGPGGRTEMAVLVRRLHVQRRQHARVLQVQVGQARRQGERGEETGHDHGGQRQQQPAGQRGAPGAATGGIVEDELSHGRWRPA